MKLAHVGCLLHVYLGHTYVMKSPDPPLCKLVLVALRNSDNVVQF